MIKTENISKEHYINNIKPDYFITLPFSKDEQIKDFDVTCFFCVQTRPMQLKCVGIEYFAEINNKILKNYRFGEYFPTHLYIFKNAFFDLKKERERLITD